MSGQCWCINYRWKGIRREVLLVFFFFLFLFFLSAKCENKSNVQVHVHSVRSRMWIVSIFVSSPTFQLFLVSSNTKQNLYITKRCTILVHCKVCINYYVGYINVLKRFSYVCAQCYASVMSWKGIISWRYFSCIILRYYSVYVDCERRTTKARGNETHKQSNRKLQKQ